MPDVLEFARDCQMLLEEKYRRGQIDRRRFLSLAGALGVGALSAGRASAQGAKQVVLVNWGGIANDAYSRCYGKPFEEANPGVKVVMDSSGPTAGKIRTMVESKKVIWDCCDSSASTSILLGNQGLLEPIDYKIVDRSNLLPKGFAYPHGVAPYSFSSVLLYDAGKFGNDPPKTWRDFLDFKKYPGKRMLRRDAASTLEALAMAGGTALEQVYPLNVKQALDVLRKIKQECVYWTSGSESEQLMRTGEATLGLIWNTRAKVLHEETKGRLTWTWNQGVLQPGIFVVPKGNPAGVLAQRLLAFATANPKGQIALLEFLGNGPTNPKAAAGVPAPLRRFNPTDPDNLKAQLVIDGEWWGKSYAQVNQDFLDAISS